MMTLFGKKRSVNITDRDPTYKVVYLGNVLNILAKGDGCVDKPLNTLWKNYVLSSKPDMSMKLTICKSGLKAVTKEHGLTEYWAHRITYCIAHPNFPKIFAWVYRHEGKKMKPELRCHAVLSTKEEKTQAMALLLHDKITASLREFKREKLNRQNVRLSLAHSLSDPVTLPRRKQLLSVGQNFKPPVERSRSAPKLLSIDEGEECDEEICTELKGETKGKILDSQDDIDDDSFTDEIFEIGNNIEELKLSNDVKTSLEGDCEQEDNVSDESGFSEQI